ncbi:DNA cytosine methyltransferase [Citrobacter portucalensis]|uniref:DNA cytosine methyltransferase n=1 Tax=Citrobacter portucalensis TaxID=1639133 RepID=UPI0023B30C08|nr:DNA cytosine methyltransferase [Citrobacter portucalensis]MDE9706068.1 DNA cytosine methyltransferase [Citrobacter portucalensis]
MNELALFAGAGGGILGGYLLGWRTVCAVERDAYAAQVLAQRQNDGILRPFPIWSDVCSFDGKPWRGIVDIVSGGFPCQDISSAGRGAGIDGNKSGLWREMARIISEVRPQFVFVENSPLLIGRGLALVISDLAEIGYDCQWSRISAEECGAPHKRDRLWLVGREVRNPAGERLPIGLAGEMERPTPLSEPQRSDWWPAEPGVGRVANGMAHRVDRIKALGNGQVPRVAAAAFSVLRRNK